MEILKSRNIVVNDEQFCVNALSDLNYYRLTAYMLPFKDSNQNTYSPITFEKIYHIYEFDRELRSLLLNVLEEIEIFVRTKLAYYHAHHFGPIAYLDSANYNQRHCHDTFIKIFNKQVYQNRENDFVKHHRDSKDGKFPIWVAVELFSFGMLSKFYADLPPRHKKKIAKEHFDTGLEQLESWLLCMSFLRNRCAHYMRLYYYLFNKRPKNTNSQAFELGYSLFDYIHVIKHCYNDAYKWNGGFLASLDSLIKKYSQWIDLTHIGFPADWKTELTKN